jgi:hypothetical protein
MPGVVVRIVRESTTSPMGYETLVEADSDNTKVETQGKFRTCFRLIENLLLLRYQ